MAARWCGAKREWEGRACGHVRVEGEGGRERGALVQWLVARGGRQRPPDVGCGRRHCCANRGRRRAWATRAKERRRLTCGTEVRRDPVSAVGCVRERKEERQGGGGVPTHGPGRRGLNRNQNSNETKLILNSFKL
jgi:hypothetical protein